MPQPPLDFLRSYSGRFLAFEGPDGSGKSTQFRRLTGALEVLGVEHTTVREPGGTVTGERIREVLLDRQNTQMTLRCEMLLYMASRADLVEHTILPALRADRLVLADRYVASTLAYQGAAGGLASADISAVARVATGGVMPDLYLLFDIDADHAAKRLNPLLDRMEAKGREFHRRVRAGYLEQARADPLRFAVIDASRDADHVWSQLVETLRERAESLPARRPKP
jgi:dTMP kinase